MYRVKKSSVVSVIIAIVLFSLIASDYSDTAVDNEAPGNVVSTVSCGSEFMCIESITFPAMHIIVPEFHP
jgi:hypothetical protein